MTEITTEAVRLLVVSREPSTLRPLWTLGECNSWQLENARGGWEALERLQSGASPDLLLLELQNGDADGWHILRWVRRLRPELPVILLSHPEHAAKKREAVRLGARDFLVRPFDEKQLESAIRRNLVSVDDRGETWGDEDVEDFGDDGDFVGTSTVMQKLRAQTELLARADVPVLLMGEPGSGRRTTAHLIHKLSVRSGFRFLKVSCAALSNEHLERELLFRKLELCNRGTIFFEEISEMPLNLQDDLLRLIQQKHFQHPGNGSSIEIDVRVIAASHLNIEAALAEKKLREDLYYRLSAFTVHIPSLRQRKSEVPFLLQHVMYKLARHYNLPPREFSPEVLELSQTYSWPGNMRQLEDFVKRYLVAGDEDLSSLGAETDRSNGDVRVLHAAREPKLQAKEAVPANVSLKSLLRDIKSEAEQNAIAAALQKTGWNRKAASRLLNVSYRTMLYKIEQYQMSAAKAYSPSLENGSALRGNGNGHRLKRNGNGGFKDEQTRPI